MKSYSVVGVLLVGLLFVCAEGQQSSDNSTTAPPQTTHITEPTTKSGTSDAPTTKNTTSTTKPTTETTKPTNATTPPTTHTTKNSTTHPATHTTKPVPTTTPQPAPYNPEAHPALNFNVNDSGRICVNFKAEIEFTIKYTTKSNGTAYAKVGLQNVTSVTGNCNSSTVNTMIVNFFDDKWQLTLTFATASSSQLGADNNNMYWWSKIVLEHDYNPKLFPNASTEYVNKTAKLETNLTGNYFQASKDGSYMCNADKRTDLGDGSYMETFHLQYNAFQTSNSTSFPDKNVSQCSDDAKTNSIVPIAVGAALAGLVVIVLIAYLIGRRRNRKGYESV